MSSLLALLGLDSVSGGEPARWDGGSPHVLPPAVERCDEPDDELPLMMPTGNPGGERGMLTLFPTECAVCECCSERWEYGPTSTAGNGLGSAVASSPAG